MIQRALLRRAAALGGHGIATLGQQASDAFSLAAAPCVEGRRLQTEAGQDALGSGGSDAWGTIPSGGAPRNVQDYNTLISLMARRRRAYKIRDIFEEMTLDGVPKNVDTYFRAMFASMQARRLGDALYYWDNMKKQGIVPDADMYGVIISAAGRANQPDIALQLLADMKARGLAPTKNAFLAALNALGEAGLVESAQELHREMMAAGVECNEFGYAALINSYKRSEPAPDDAADRILDLMEQSRQGSALDFSRKVEQGIGIVVFNAGLNAFSALGFHERLVHLFTTMQDSEGLAPDYDSYSAVIKSYLKESVCGYRQFSPSHPASRRDPGAPQSAQWGEISSAAEDLSDAPPTRPLPQWAARDPDYVAPEYAHLPPEVGTHLTKLKGRVDLEAWARVTELYEITVSKGMTLSPGLHYDLMRTAVLIANAGHLDALHFAQQCLDDMQHLGMFLNTQSGSVLLAACSRRELAAGLPFAHRLWDLLLMSGRVPKTQATVAYLRALQERESDWEERIAQCKQVLNIDPGRLRRPVGVPQLPPGEHQRRRAVLEQRKERYKAFNKESDRAQGWTPSGSDDEIPQQ